MVLYGQVIYYRTKIYTYFWIKWSWRFHKKIIWTNILKGLLSTKSSSSILNKLFISFGMLFETNVLHLTSHDNVYRKVLAMFSLSLLVHNWDKSRIIFSYVATAQLLRYDIGTNIRDRNKSILILSNEFDHLLYLI